MSSAIRRIATRVACIATFSQLVATACDPTAPEDPNDQRNFVPDASLTVAVATITASPVSWNEIDLKWTNSAGVTGYEVFRSTTGATGTYTQISTTANVGTYASVGLSGSTQYCYEVRAFKNAGKNISYGSFSSAACATTLPPPINPPTEIDAIPEGYRVLIRWKDNSDNEDGFRIAAESGGSSESLTVPANTTSTYFNYPPSEQVWCFTVSAFNALAVIGSNFDCTVLPASPTNLSAATLDAQSITLSWTDNSRFEEAYKVSRSDQAGQWTDLAAVPANTVTYRDIAATPDISYTYRVQALRDGGFSSSSNEAVAVIPTTVPAAPSNPQAFFAYDYETPYGWLTVSISWTDASSNEDGFIIEYSQDGTNYWGYYTQAPANVSSIQQQFMIDFGPEPGCFRVIAFNVLGNSEPSNVGCAQTNLPPSANLMIQSSPAGIKSHATVQKNRETSTGPIGGKRVTRSVPTIPRQ
jgi:hypothetical protein